MNKMKRHSKIFLFPVFLALWGLLGLSGIPRADGVEFPVLQGFVNDNAGILSKTAKTQLESLCSTVNAKTTAEMVIVTVKTTRPLSVEQYAVELFQEWGIGRKSEDNGVLLLVASGDRSVRIEVGYGLEETITDLQSKIIIENLMIPHFKKNDFNTGIAAGSMMLAKLIADRYGVDIDIKKEEGVPVQEEGADWWSILIGLCILMVFIYFFGSGWGPFFYSTTVGSKKRYWSSGGGGSFGGGFGGFGGGSSGGGGASGSW